jgi:hypothetical protein
MGVADGILQDSADVGFMLSLDARLEREVYVHVTSKIEGENFARLKCGDLNSLW